MPLWIATRSALKAVAQMTFRIIFAMAVLAMSVGLGGSAALAAESQDQKSATEQRFSPQDIQADFAALYRGLQSAHYDLYAFTPKSRLDRSYRQHLATLNRPMTLFEVKTRFELFAAEVRMGHTRVDFPSEVWKDYRKGDGKAFPLDIRVVDGRTYVAGNQSGLDTIARGDEIVRLNGEPMSRWLDRTEHHVSAETPYMAHSLMEYDFPIYLWVELGNVEGFDLAIRKAGGKLVRVRVPARTSAEMKAFAAAQPPMLALDEPLRDARILDGGVGGGVGYLRPGPFYNAQAKVAADEWDVSGFRTFIDEAFHKFNTAGTERLIIDLRGNPGGDNLFSDVMVAWFADRPFRFFSQFKVRVSPESVAANQERIEHDAVAAGPVSRQYADLYARSHTGAIVDFDVAYAQPRQGERYTGKVFLLVDRQSYSNTVAVAALVQDYRFGTVLGEETSDMATTYGAMERFTLPHTGIAVGFPKARIVRPNGDLRSRGVTPDIRIDIPVVQTIADEVLRQAVAIARR